MDYSVIGKKIRELRKAVGLTQGDLAENICTQALISRIEKGDIYPSATALYQISNRLGVDVNYFFEIGTTPRLDYINEVERQLTRLRVDQRFQEMMEIVKTEEKNPLFFKDNEKLQLLLWHKSIYFFEVEKESETALTILNEAYNLTANQKKAMTEREMEILITFGIWETQLGDHQKALDYYQKVEVAINPAEQLQDKSIKTRLLYNIARVLTRTEHYESSTDYCLKAIHWCIDEELLWGLGESYYQIGFNYELMEKIDQAIPYFQKALLMFELRNNTLYSTFIEEKLAKLGV
ncbi:helix-turn-helix transcriptional regulator [Rossellomorea vietnamensis]|uniref:helix-turn-helix domain-containing protein n=1 Tax=Rossellomorea vietnamensis TaxID=218284 RepID=UPI001CC9A69C|nr:helix-turn-helix domain-containing protein [Rossellomorea vietnamensis]MCA0150441.1 helix-turn-helix transcriptional regulator [Rossellomorea vietnamensis]